MLKQNKKSWRYLATALLMLCVSCSAAHGAISGIDIRYIPKGWEAQKAGYYMDEATGRDVVMHWKLDRDELASLKGAYSDLRAAVKDSANQQVESLRRLEQELQRERRIARAKSQRALGQGLMWGAVIGIVVGVVASR